MTDTERELVEAARGLLEAIGSEWCRGSVYITVQFADENNRAMARLRAAVEASEKS